MIDLDLLCEKEKGEKKHRRRENLLLSFFSFELILLLFSNKAIFASNQQRDIQFLCLFKENYLVSFFFLSVGLFTMMS